MRYDRTREARRGLVVIVERKEACILMTSADSKILFDDVESVMGDA